MLISPNQTLSNNNVPVRPNPGYEWYPFAPGQCPPSYYVILQGVCAPLIIIISTVLNSLIAVVLLQKQLRSPTNILLLAIALYDTMTGLFPFPAYIYMYTFKKCDDYPPFNFGWFHRINYEILPFIFHTCSIWVTVVLAIQRYIYVCHSEKAKRWCTVPMALKAIACVNVLALIVAIPMFFEGSFHPQTIHSLHDPKQIFDACLVLDHSQNPKFSTFFSAYPVLRALLINIGPCTILVILNAILVERMREAKQNRERLIKKRFLESRAQEQTSVTLMLVIVVTLFLIVEVPIALQLIISGLLKLIKPDLFSEFLNTAGQLLNFAVLLSYPINFFIYCRMSRAFRDAFTELLCPDSYRSRQERSPSNPVQLTSKLSTGNINNNHQLVDLTNKHNTDMINQPRSSVIHNNTTAETPLSSPKIPSKKSSIHSLGKQRVIFSDDLNASKNIQSTDL